MIHAPEQAIADDLTPPAATPDDLAAIELLGVAKEFGSRNDPVHAVEQVDLGIRQGEFFSLLGPSGCGKTTTLRMIAGFEEPTRGQILLYGKDVTGVPPNHRDVNMVFQSYALFPHLDVAGNIAFGLKRKKVPPGEIRGRVAEIIELVDLGGKEKRKPRELSGGQQQRVALARALVNRPRALLLDEPLSALDRKLRQSMQLELKRIQREVGITFVFVTHDQGEALAMSDRVAIMSEGRVEQLGSPREVYEHPATRFVAEFIGTSNILTGVVDRVASGSAIVQVSPEERIAFPLRHSHTPGDTVELTVRPEKITVTPHRPDTDCLLRGTIREVIYLGTSTNYTVTTSLGTDVVVFSQNHAADADDLARGAEVWLSWDPANSYPLADSGSGRS